MNTDKTREKPPKGKKESVGTVHESCRQAEP
jgi:hypothetical protein